MCGCMCVTVYMCIYIVYVCVCVCVSFYETIVVVILGEYMYLVRLHQTSVQSSYQ